MDKLPPFQPHGPPKPNPEERLLAIRVPLWDVLTKWLLYSQLGALSARKRGAADTCRPRSWEFSPRIRCRCGPHSVGHMRYHWRLRFFGRFCETKQWAIRTVWCAATALVAVSSLLPDDSPLMKTVDQFDISDKILHFGAYFVLSLLAIASQTTRRRSLIAALLMGVLGIVLEGLQGLTPTRSADILDAITGSIGVICGTSLGLALL